METDILSVNISPMTANDVDNVLVVEESAYGDHHWSKDSFMNELSNDLAHYWCAYCGNGEIAGYAGCWQILEEAHITTIAVKPELRCKKVGEALLKTIIESCYKNMVKYITLEVRVSNTPAIKLYEKYGFKSLGTRKGYYQNNNEDALIMWTENIFYDTFKLPYEEKITKLREKININA